MHHIFYFDGNTEEISWAIQTEDTIVNENRTHVEIYKNKITNVQSKYVALHVGLFWGIGVFIIKNEDSITIKIDEKEMYDHFIFNLEKEDEFIQKRIQFINQLSKQRKLKINYEKIERNENISIEENQSI